MTGNEFVKKVRQIGKERGLPVDLVPNLGKGSHATLFLGTRRTTIKDRKKEIGAGLLGKMLADLGLTRKDLG